MQALQCLQLDLVVPAGRLRWNDRLTHSSGYGGNNSDGLRTTRKPEVVVPPHEPLGPRR